MTGNPAAGAARTAAAGAAISFSGVGKAFAGPGGARVHALDDVTLAVEPGAICGIIGRSGAGKSTLLRMVNGLERPTSGTVTVAGRDVGRARGAALRAIRREVGMIFQHFNLLSSRTVAGNIALPLEIAGEPAEAIRARVTDLIARVGLDGLAARYPAELSGGQKQRVNLARALAAEPDLILCDEITSALDTVVAAAILDLLKELQRELNLSYMFISHDLSTVEAICDEVLVMLKGRVVEALPAARMSTDATHPYSRLLIGSIPKLDTGWLKGLEQDPALLAQFAGR